jgi:Na+(H+)/acetate symporter ActP
MLTVDNDVKVEQEFEVFVDLSTTLSLKVTGEDEKRAVEKALSQLDEDAIQQLLLTLVLHNGTVAMPKVHDFRTDNINVFVEEE